MVAFIVLLGIKEYNKYYENIDVIVNDKGKVVLE